MREKWSVKVMGENDLISREAVLDYEHRGFIWGADVRSIPAVDAVEVVRCKNCRHWGTGYGGETENIKVCEYANYMVSKNGYCVYAERKMDGENECSAG